MAAGVIQPTTGDIRAGGQPRRFAGLRDAQDCGIAMIHQELNLAPHMTVAENIWVGREPRRLGFVDHAALLEQIGLQLDPDERVGNLVVADQISDVISVFRDGRQVATDAVSAFDQNRLITLMVGRELPRLLPKGEAKLGDTVLSARGLALDGVFHDVSFDLRRGEIPGMAGLVGAGRTNVAETLFGLTPATGGKLLINGKPVRIAHPAQALRHGMALLTEDRKLNGLFLMLSVLENIHVASVRGQSGQGIVRQSKLSTACAEMVRALRVKTPGLDKTVENLSGGNQQKALIARWLMTKPCILILDEPRRGVDLGAKAEIHRLMSELAQQGLSVIMMSSELPEVLGMSDRTMMMHEGRASGFLAPAEATQEKVMQLAAR